MEHNSMDMRQELEAIRCPTLVLAGTRDPINPLKDVQDMVARLPRHLVTFQLFEEQRHNLSKDIPMEYFAAIERWLRSQLPAAQQGAAADEPQRA